MDYLRYSRQLPLIGLDGQQLLLDARVLIIGAGGLGCPVGLYLAAAGVGHLGLVDGDVVDLSNLQRQILYREQDIGRNKAEVAVQQLKERNHLCRATAFPVVLDEHNVRDICREYQFLVDATDNFKARYLINSISKAMDKPLVSASIFRYSAQISVFNYDNGPCYECLYPAPPPDELIPNCAEGGIIGVVAGMAGLIQANEVMKIILGQPKVLSGILLTLNTINYQLSQYPVDKKPYCTQKHCSQNKSEPLLQDLPVPVIDVLSAQKWLSTDGHYQLLDVRESWERSTGHIGGLHIPLAELEKRYLELPKDKYLIIYCKGGVRSAKAVRLLLKKQFNHLYSLEGGIMAWRELIDGSLPLY